ncbi:vacuolar protein sorting-associated protein 18 homolog [Ischnura elegans]|uniref:vacuolar protein sorting-associated protein 18 homolog n=1 Tax=Ischnura elegans TaxID=197161 RepID=UPI001ED8AD55|nr:vacuolar protein sorting-associated protein 18 homolog [Ischnura elegans]
MASYYQSSQPIQRSKSGLPRPEMNKTGVIYMKLEEDVPIFSKYKVDYPLQDKICHLVVSSDILVLALANNKLLRIDLRQPDTPEEIDINKHLNQTKISSLFLDPLGNHLLISLSPDLIGAQAELLYVPKKSTRAKQLSKFKGHIITAVAWNFGNDAENTTGPILLGTSKGIIIESEIGMENDRIFQTSLEQYWKQVFDIGKGSETPITGIEFHHVPRTDRYFIIVTTITQLYQFIGETVGSDERPVLQQIFSKYFSKPEMFLAMVSSLSYSKLQFHYPSSRSVPKNVAWLTGSGLYTGKIDVSTLSGADTVIFHPDMVQFPKTTDPSLELSTTPLSFILTEFHALLLYVDHVKGICTLNNELIFEDMHNEAFGQLINITKDPVRNTIWAYSEKAVFKYKVAKEDRNVWQVYVEKGMFDLAKQYCQDNPAHMDQVLIKQAESFFEEEQYEESAIHYAKTHCSFEEIALKFLQANEIEALKMFLIKKLETLKEGDKTQITMIVVWVTELFLKQLGTLKNEDKTDTPEYMILKREFDAFLTKKEVIGSVRDNQDTLYKLMASHGDKDNMIQFAMLNRDFEKVVHHHISKNNFHEALEILKTENKKELFYQFAPTLMQAIPKLTFQVIINHWGGLDPSKLIPALITCDKNDAQVLEVINYLEYCVYSLRTQEPAIHNYLLTLYAKRNSPKLMSYLTTQGQDGRLVCYDIHYALKLCREHNLTEACVQLSTLLGMWEAAVDLALQVGPELAKRTASMPPPTPGSDPDLRKRLWLKIAEHVVKEKDDIQEAMEFIQQCDLIKIEDILPFFSDFVTIDHFKDAICTSLQEYNQHIQDLKEEMDEATKSAEVIRQDIQSFRNRHTVIRAHDLCCVCDCRLLARAFYVFPCGHLFHSDCLLHQVHPLLPTGKRNRLHDLQKQLATFSLRDDTASLGSSSLGAREQIKGDIDNIVASECLFCGEMMIRSIDQPFIEDENFDRVFKEWL